MLYKKRGKIAISQILILVIGIIAFSYFIGEEFKLVNAVDIPPGYVKTDSPGIFVKDYGLPTESYWSQAGGFGTWKGTMTKGTMNWKGHPATTTTPTHGYAGAGYEKLFGKGSTLPEGTVLSGGEISSGLGYSVSGIIQGETLISAPQIDI